MNDEDTKFLVVVFLLIANNLGLLAIALEVAEMALELEEIARKLVP